MPISFRQQKKKQKYLLVIVILVVITTLLVLWFGGKEKAGPVIIKSASFVREIKIDLEILENPFIEKLQPFEKALPFDGIKGRENPFLPY